MGYGKEFCHLCMEFQKHHLLPSRWRSVRNQMITMKIYMSLFMCMSFGLLATAQGTFQNLNFESANLTPVPSGQFGGLVPITKGLPGWTGYVGTAQATQVLQNNLSTGAAS